MGVLYRSYEKALPGHLDLRYQFTVVTRPLYQDRLMCTTGSNNKTTRFNCVCPRGTARAIASSLP
eukprot:2920322-Pleurochrysis_carterae.AAC.1